MLIVTSQGWQLNDAGDFAVLCSASTPTGVTAWKGGDFIDKNKVVVVVVLLLLFSLLVISLLSNDSGNFAVLCSASTPAGFTAWKGSDFIVKNKVLVVVLL